MTKVLVRDLVCVAVIPLVLGLCFASRIATGFHVSSVFPVVIVLLTLVIHILRPVYGGVLSGMQVFKGIALLGIAGSFSRLFFGVIFVAMGFGATGALVGNAIGSVVMLFLIILFSCVTAYIPKVVVSKEICVPSF